MKRSSKTPPDRIILFESGLIIALLLVNWALQLSYMPGTVPVEEDIYEPWESFHLEEEKALPEESKKEESEPFKKESLEKFKLVNNTDLLNTEIKKLVSPGLFKGPGLIKIPRIISGKGQYNKIDSFAEQMPQFPGGHEALKAFVRHYYKVNEHMSFMGEDIELIVSFVVRMDGSIDDIEVLSCNLKGLGAEREIVKVFSYMPLWEPGFSNGRAVNVRLILPVKIEMY